MLEGFQKIWGMFGHVPLLCRWSTTLLQQVYKGPRGCIGCTLAPNMSQGFALGLW